MNKSQRHKCLRNTYSILIICSLCADVPLSNHSFIFDNMKTRLFNHCVRNLKFELSSLFSAIFWLICD